MNQRKGKRKHAKKASSPPRSRMPVYQLKVTLLNIRPTIWRRFIIPGGTNLGLLHSILQIIMGWTNSHLHMFNVGDLVYGSTEPDCGPSEDSSLYLDEDQASLMSLLPRPKACFTYVYDFGDSWEHLLEVEKIHAPGAFPGHWVQCLDGKRACPPDDCGGPWGYADFLKAIRNPRNPDHEEMLAWIGRPFDAELYDLQHINRCLRHLKWPRTTAYRLASILAYRDQPRGWLKLPEPVEA